MARCEHQTLCFEVSRHAIEAGYSQPTLPKRLAAAQPSGRAPSSTRSRAGERDGDASQPPLDSTFAAPLVLPGDELAWNPKYPPQSLRSWTGAKYRNPVTSQRRTIYVVPPPKVDESVAFVSSWAQPTGVKDRVTAPAMEEVLAYLQAFYHGLEVKLMRTSDLHFDTWDKRARTKRTQPHNLAAVSLEIGSEAVRIRTRPSHDGVFSGQLNLNDLLDVAMSILPEDAYALVMLVDHDLYEDEEDDFCCGRAYGGSRVAVVSMARYHPLLDRRQGVKREHAWPASHCKTYIDRCCNEESAKVQPKKRQRKGAITAEDTAHRKESPETAIGDAVAAYRSHSTEAGDKTMDALLSALWLGRVCKTASHELGHCFGLDHCVYYACIMQGTAGLSEDARQPPYLCPVDMAKLLKATGVSEREWVEAMLGFCERYEEAEGDGLFAAFAAWLRVRFRQTEVV
ncbi:hypothetical protein LTR85_007180 [Meristemomyces frigidus]|nr:hypothetical protein LTR85_007180 [Meristemomyces frigidus]